MKLTLGLDTAPDVRHLGVYVAAARGWYPETGVELEMSPPQGRSSSLDTIERVLSGECMIALVGADSLAPEILSNPKPLYAITAVTQREFL